MVTILSLSISIIALIISGLTFYYSRLQSGKVKMTRPTTIFFGPDGLKMEYFEKKKIYIRTLLYSTSDRGQYIQNMYVRLKRGDAIQHFNVWVYGDGTLARGSGLYVDKSGITSSHHFLLPKNGAIFDFLPGDYNIQVFVEIVNKKPYKIFEQTLTITALQYAEVIDSRSGLYYDWAPDGESYHPHLAGILTKDKPINFVS